MRIGIDGRYISGHFPGVGRYTAQLIQALAETAPRPITVFTGQRPVNDTLTGGLTEGQGSVRHWPIGAPVFSVQSQLALAAAVRSAGVTLLHTPYPLPPVLAPCRHVTTVFDVIPLVFPDALPTWRHRATYRLLAMLATRASRRIITLSRSARDDLVRYLGARPERIVVVPAGVDRRFRPVDAFDRDAVRSRYGLPRTYVLTVGINKPHKNLVRLVDAFQRVETAAGLVIAGPEDSRYSGVRARATHAGGRVRILGPVPDEDLPALYSAARLVVVPSLYEGFGLPALEAMACGTPVLCSDRASLPEVVGEAGALVDPTDTAAMATAIANLLADDQARPRMAQAGLRRAAQFTWEGAARATWQVYQEALG